jgi:RNA polymerase sigma-70 factor, Bacteroides expansion family 1
MDLQEQTIWKSIQEKDLETFESYYKTHYKSFFLMACKYLKDTVQAEEIVNDVFLKIWEDGTNINIESSLKSYIYKAIANRSLNALQKSKRQYAHQADFTQVPDNGYEMKHLEEHELAVKLYTAIDHLPEQCRKVFELSRFEELKQQEIAEKLGISIKTVKNHITIALKQLTKSLSSYSIILILIVKNLFQL